MSEEDIFLTWEDYHLGAPSVRPGPPCKSEVVESLRSQKSYIYIGCHMHNPDLMFLHNQHKQMKHILSKA